MSSGTMAPGRDRIPVRFDRYEATIDTPLALSASVRSLFADQIRPDSERVGALVLVDTNPNRLSVDGRPWNEGGNESLLDELLYMLMQASLEADPERLHLHVGLVVHRNRSVLLGGVPGSGKSTLIAELVRSGFDYGTDERVSIDRHGEISVFEKPISVVRTSFEVLQALDPAVTGRGSVSERLWHIPASGVRIGAQLSSVPPPTAVVLVEYRAGEPPVATAMHPVTVARVLLADSIDVERFGPDGPMVVARLCASVPCFSLVHAGGPAAVGCLVHQLDQLDSSAAGTAARHEITAITGGTRASHHGPIGFGSTSVIGRARGISGVLLAERMLIRTAAGRIVELDERQTAWVQLFDGSTSLGALVAEVALANGLAPSDLLQSTISLAEELAEAGVIA